MTDYAFPQPNRLSHEGSGMELRDYFAAKALHACIMQRQFRTSYTTGQSVEFEYLESNDDLARKAYALADAMMKARKVQP